MAQGRCGALDRNGSHRLMALENGTIRTFDLVGVGVALEKYVTVEVSFEVLYAQAMTSECMEQEVEHSGLSPAHLPTPRFPPSMINL